MRSENFIGANQEGRILSGGDTYNTTVYVDHVEDLDTILRIAKNARITTRMGEK